MTNAFVYLYVPDFILLHTWSTLNIIKKEGKMLANPYNKK